MNLCTVMKVNIICCRRIYLFIVSAIIIVPYFTTVLVPCSPISWKNLLKNFITAPNHMIWEIRIGVVFLRGCGLPI